MESERFVPFVLYTERIAKNIKRLEDKNMLPYGLRSAHVMCILQLAKSENGLSSTELGIACGVDKAFISRITGELVEKEYIVRSGLCSKYKTKFVLTDEGKKIHTIIENLICEFIQKISKDTSIKKLEIFYEVLRSIDDNLANITDEEINNENC